MIVKVGNKSWGLTEVEKHPAPVTSELVRLLDRDDWSLQDIHEASQMIEQLPVVKEVVLQLIKLIYETTS